MLPSKDNNEASRLHIVLEDMLIAETDSELLQELRKSGVETFDDFLDICECIRALHTMYCKAPLRRTGNFTQVGTKGRMFCWHPGIVSRARIYLLRAEAQVFDPLVDERASSAPRSLMFRRSNDELFFNYELQPTHCLNSANGAKLPGGARSAATRIEKFSSVASTAVDAPKSPATRTSAATSLPKIVKKENAAPQPELSVSSQVESKLVGCVGNSVVAPTQVDLVAPKSVLSRSSSSSLVLYPSNEENAEFQIEPSMASPADSKMAGYVKNSVDAPTRVDLASLKSVLFRSSSASPLLLLRKEENAAAQADTITASSAAVKFDRRPSKVSTVDFDQAAPPETDIIRSFALPASPNTFKKENAAPRSELPPLSPSVVDRGPLSHPLPPLLLGLSPSLPPLDGELCAQSLSRLIVGSFGAVFKSRMADETKKNSNGRCCADSADARDWSHGELSTKSKSSFLRLIRPSKVLASTYLPKASISVLESSRTT